MFRPPLTDVGGWPINFLFFSFLDGGIMIKIQTFFIQVLQFWIYFRDPWLSIEENQFLLKSFLSSVVK